MYEIIEVPSLSKLVVPFFYMALQLSDIYCVINLVWVLEVKSKEINPFFKET